MSAQTQKLEKLLGYGFSNPALLETALVHASAGASAGAGVDGNGSNERMEFLGDRVLGLAIAHILYNRFPGEDEGRLARRFAALTSGDALAMVAAEIDLEKFVTTSPNDASSGERGRQSLLADGMEAVLGAIYLDGGLDAASSFIASRWESMLAADVKPPKDAKTALQEWSQARGLGLPSYEVLSQSGPAHAPVFCVRVSIDGNGNCEGEGSSRKAAEMSAASAMLESIGAAGGEQS